MNLDALSLCVETLLVRRNLRSMGSLQAVMKPGYYLRAARLLVGAQRVILGTGFPVADTFETDGPPGAIALYRALSTLGCQVHLACADPLASVLNEDFRVLTLGGFDPESGHEEARHNLAALKPDVVISVERPGLADDQRYYNMRGEDISPHCAVFDYYLQLSDCPSIGIGDGGNEIGMGNLREVVEALDIQAAATTCDELLVADVSNWGAYGLVAMLEAVSQKPLLSLIEHTPCLLHLSERGSVDGITRNNTQTEDGLPAAAGEALLLELQELCNHYSGASATRDDKELND